MAGGRRGQGIAARPATRHIVAGAASRRSRSGATNLGISRQMGPIPRKDLEIVVPTISAERGLGDGCRSHVRSKSWVPQFFFFFGVITGIRTPLPISLLTFAALSRASRFIFGLERSYFREGVPSKDEEQPNGLQVCLRLRDGKSGQGALTVHFCTTSRPRPSQP
jgi:hypothetical protein